jgi:hypothetical protein
MAEKELVRVGVLDSFNIYLRDVEYNINSVRGQTPIAPYGEE